MQQKAEAYCLGFCLFQAKADQKTPIHPLHHGIIQMTDLFFQPLFINGTDLFQKDDRILGQGIYGGGKGNMCGQLGFIHLGCNGSADDSGAVLVAHIILHDEDRADAALFTAYHRTQVCKINISTSDDHVLTLRCLVWSAAEENMYGFRNFPADCFQYCQEQEGLFLYGEKGFVKLGIEFEGGIIHAITLLFLGVINNKADR